jgi:alpha-galactosidase
MLGSSLTVAVFSLGALLREALALDNGVGVTPALGYNTYQSPWSFQGGDALLIADALEETGLKELGFRFVNSDCGWQSNKNGRDERGLPIANMPNITETAATLHHRGFKMGLYSSLSSVQCGGAPGGLYHEDLDAEYYSTLGLDYLKYDNCAEYALEPNARSSPMRDALNRTGCKVLFSTEPFDLSPNAQAHIANLWRTTTDVADTTEKVRVNIDLNDKWAEFAGPGGFNDPDSATTCCPNVPPPIIFYLGADGCAHAHTQCSNVAKAKPRPRTSTDPITSPGL